MILLWSPGSASDAKHPGDDEKADDIVRMTSNRARLTTYRTDQLKGLIGALAACDAVVCSDGGASHLAAGLGKPIVCVVGDSPVERWRPWGVPLRLIHPASRVVADIPVDEVVAAFASLSQETGIFGHPAS